MWRAAIRNSPLEQARVQDRMTQWAAAPKHAAKPACDSSRPDNSPQERQQKWEAYQALSAEDRHALAQKARRKQHPVLLADDVAGPREQSQVFSGRTLWRRFRKKIECGPHDLSSAPGPTSASPSLVKASRGATTTLVNERTTPPMHQQTGCPKLPQPRGFVDPKPCCPERPTGCSHVQHAWRQGHLAPVHRTIGTDQSVRHLPHHRPTQVSCC